MEEQSDLKIRKLTMLQRLTNLDAMGIGRRLAAMQVVLMGATLSQAIGYALVRDWAKALALLCIRGKATRSFLDLRIKTRLTESNSDT
ncbi:MAG: hypothetical protein K2P58_07175 [Hyphomonadaceae bacterium]|nr:hypothetical protein [Hyphomonadaceae bacterium]